MFTSKKSPNVAVMILNFNGLRWLKICLPSIEKSTFRNLDTYVIDDGGSTDGSIEYVKMHHPRVKMIIFNKPRGFAEAHNSAIRRIESDYVVLLNNDTRVLKPDWIQHLLKVAHADAGIAAVNCKIVTMKDPSRLDSVGAMGIPYWRGFVDIGKEEVDRGVYNGEFEPFAFSGAAALLRRDSFLGCGGFDSRFRFYVEDSDLSWRFRLYGFRVGFASRAKVAHYYSGTIGPGTYGNKLYFCHRNVLATIIKNCGSTLMWALRNYFLYSVILAFGFAIPQPQATVKIVKGVLWNLYHLRGTYKRRLIIQQRRCVSEYQILERLFPPIHRYQPEEYAGQRRFFNILFESSQLTLLHHHMRHRPPKNLK